MIITRSPFRISLGGGGTDLPSYYGEYEGFLVGAAIDKYSYVTLLQHDFYNDIVLKYAELERVANVDDIKHSRIREALRAVPLSTSRFEIASIADVPSGTGMGSSGAFTCALLKALHTQKGETVSPKELAEEACNIEINVLKEPVGKQDQYLSAFGGINTLTFRRNGDVEVSPLSITQETRNDLEDNLLLFFTGKSRSAAAVLQEQDDKSKQKDPAMLDNLHFIKDLGRKSQRALESGDLDAFADLMNVHWERKKERSGSMTSGRIDEAYAIALKNGARGGKLIGAGGGGFLMFYADDNVKLRHAMAREGLMELRKRFDSQGTRVVTLS